MTKKEWEKVINLEMKKSFDLANMERIRGNRLTTKFMLGYHEGLRYALAAMKDEIIIPEIEYHKKEEE